MGGRLRKVLIKPPERGGFQSTLKNFSGNRIFQEAPIKAASPRQMWHSGENVASFWTAGSVRISI
jgi:hypothetical protein